MKKSCIIRPHRAGLWSLINNVATCGELYERVRVLWESGDPNLIYSANAGNANLWEFLFEANPSLEGIPNEDTDCIYDYPDQHLTYKNVARHYANPDDPWRKVYRGHFLSWRVRPAWLHQATRFVNGIDAPLVAVQVRADTHAGEQTSGRSQSLDDYADVLHVAIRHTKEETGLTPKVMVVASDWETVGYFQKHFGARYFNGPRRGKTRQTDFHLNEPQTYKDAADCLCEVLAMSCAHALVHPVSNMATGALYINPSLQSFYIP